MQINVQTPLAYVNPQPASSGSEAAQAVPAGAQGFGQLLLHWMTAAQPSVSANHGTQGALLPFPFGFVTSSQTVPAEGWEDAVQLLELLRMWMAESEQGPQDAQDIGELKELLAQVIAQLAALVNEGARAEGGQMPLQEAPTEGESGVDSGSWTVKQALDSLRQLQTALSGSRAAENGAALAGKAAESLETALLALASQNKPHAILPSVDPRQPIAAKSFRGALIASAVPVQDASAIPVTLFRRSEVLTAVLEASAAADANRSTAWHTAAITSSEGTASSAGQTAAGQPLVTAESMATDPSQTAPVNGPQLFTDTKSAPVVRQEIPVVHAQRFAEEAGQVLLKSMKFSLTDGVSEARLSLHPEQLGQVQVKITISNGQLVAQFIADTAMGKEAIESQLPQLRMALQNQGIQVEKLEVTHFDASQAAHSFQDPHQRQAFHAPERTRTDAIAEYDEAGEWEFDEGGVSMTVGRVMGSSFEATA